MCIFVCFRNSSALPSVGEMSEINSSSGGTRKDANRKMSVMLPNGSSSNMIESSGKTTGSSLAAAGSNVIGGIDNYKRYQMLVSQSTAYNDPTNKRSQSLLDSKKYPIKRTGTMNDNISRKKTSKLS